VNCEKAHGQTTLLSKQCQRTEYQLQYCVTILAKSTIRLDLVNQIVSLPARRSPAATNPQTVRGDGAAQRADQMNLNRVPGASPRKIL
jgi:hypothetical protein